jgi:hypothetical protein
MSSFTLQTREVRHVCSLRPCVFIFINDMEYINIDNYLAPLIGGTTISGLLFADDLVMSSFTNNGLQKEIDQIASYCKEWNLEV